MFDSNRSKPVPVTILTGFLGAGKTTLLNRILSDAEVAELEARLRAINARAPIAHAHFGETDISETHVRSSNLNAILEIEPDFLERVI